MLLHILNYFAQLNLKNNALMAIEWIFFTFTGNLLIYLKTLATSNIQKTLPRRILFTASTLRSEAMLARPFYLPCLLNFIVASYAVISTTAMYNRHVPTEPCTVLIINSLVSRKKHTRKTDSDRLLYHMQTKYFGKLK